ncbi:MAG TPA: hypothetical protein VGN90_17480 [Pyrinomonadaceae bacterium]|jgi:hypothetical protein|nr:hypothetical protein [Pyrinomonadaceae bacterium]
MRNLILLVVIAVFSVGELASSNFAQTQNGAQEQAASLRAQLLEVETKQAELQTRLQRLDEDLKPENIEQRLAGVGSLHPEDLREQRRRQLETERTGVQKQLDLLTASHSRLETAIARAETEAYRQSAAPVTTPISGTPSTSASANSSATTNEATTPVHQRRSRRKKARKSKRSHHAQPASPRIDLLVP